MLLATLFLMTLVVWYWDTQRKIFVAIEGTDENCSISTTYVKAMSVEEAKEKGREAACEGIDVPYIAALLILWDRFKWAWPFLWDLFRLILAPFLFDRIIVYLFSGNPG